MLSRIGRSIPSVFLFFAPPDQRETGEQQVDAERLAKQLYINGRGEPGAERSCENSNRNRRFQSRFIQIPAFGVTDQSADGGGEEEEKIDALRGPLVHPQKQGHDQKQQRSAANAPGGDDAGAETTQEGEQIFRHSRYFTPA